MRRAERFFLFLPFPSFLPSFSFFRARARACADYPNAGSRSSRATATASFFFRRRITFGSTLDNASPLNFSVTTARDTNRPNSSCKSGRTIFGAGFCSCRFVSHSAASQRLVSDRGERFPARGAITRIRSRDFEAREKTIRFWLAGEARPEKFRIRHVFNYALPPLPVLHRIPL